MYQFVLKGVVNKKEYFISAVEAWDAITEFTKSFLKENRGKVVTEPIGDFPESVHSYFSTGNGSLLQIARIEKPTHSSPRIAVWEEDEWYRTTIRGQKFAFTESRIDPATVPEGYFMHEVRSTDDGSEACEIKDHIAVNFFGTIIGKTQIGSEKLPWDEVNPEHGSAIILKFSDTPEYFENENGITDDPETDGEENEPHYCPLADEWEVDYYPLSIEEIVKEL